MFLAHFAETALRVAVLLGLALAAMPLLRRAPSATRRLVLALALGGALVLPILSAVAPAWRVEAPAVIPVFRGHPVAEPLVEGGAVAAAPGAGEGVATAVTAVRSRVGAGEVLAGIWALGALLVLARLLLGIARSRSMVRRSAPAASWSVAVARAEVAVGLRARVRMTDELDGPAVTGVFAPVVLVPRASEVWSEERRFAVLLHELAHVRQQDCLAQIVAQLACAVHWFDPLAWTALRRLRVERELAADDAVITAGGRASSYAADLLDIAGLGIAPRAVPPGALGMAERSQLGERVAAIVSTERARRPLSGAGAALLLAGSATTLLAVACATPSAPAASEPRAAASAPLPASSAAPLAGTTIDPRIQAIADEELDRLVAEWKPTAGAVLVLDPRTGEILADAGRAHGARTDVARLGTYLPGSTLKAVTLAAALDDGVVTPGDRFDCENGKRSYGARTLRDAGAYGTLPLPEVLAVSSNIGFSKVFDRLGEGRLDGWMRRFHFDPASQQRGAGVPDAAWDGAMLANGESMAATPLQVASAFAVFANGGAYLAPTLVRRAGSAPGEQLLKAETARAVVAMLEEAVNGERATGKLARVAGVRVAGKTGTAEWTLPDGSERRYMSFVGLVPATAPRFVILVGVEMPHGEESGGTVAAPAFARVATRALGG